MKKIIVLLLSISLTTALFSQTEGKAGFYDFVVKDINGETFKLADLKGKKVMVVNTASKCGLTPQYELLQKLYEEYAETGFVVVGFPANNFMGQEPGSNTEIKEFCTSKYSVTFPMMEKISVKGDDMHPLYQWLTLKEKNGVMDSEVKWNFQKYLIGENGQLEKVIAPKESPYSNEIIDWLKK